MAHETMGHPWILGQVYNNHFLNYMRHKRYLEAHTKRSNTQHREVKKASGVVTHTHNPSTLEAETGLLSWVQGQDGLQGEILSQKEINKKGREGRRRGKESKKERGGSEGASRKTLLGVLPRYLVSRHLDKEIGTSQARMRTRTGREHRKKMKARSGDGLLQ